MAVNSDVRWFHSGMPGAPVLTPSGFGSFIALLKACLVDGFGAQAVDGITVSDGLATVSVSSGNGFPEHAVVVVAGSNQGLLNGVWRVKTPTSNSFMFECPGVPDGAAGGSITVGVAKAVDWSMPFEDSAAKKAVFRSVKFGATGFFLQVDDSSQYRLLTAYESMSGIDTGTDQFLTSNNSISFGSASTTPLPWLLVADSCAFHFVGDFKDFAGRGCLLFFGDLDPIVSSDAFGCAVIGCGSPSSQPISYTNYYYCNSLNTYSRVARNFSGSLKSVTPTSLLPANRTNSGIATSSNVLPSASTYGGAIPMLGRIAISAPAADNVIRSFIPGAVVPGAFLDLGSTDHRSVVTDTNGGVYMALNASADSNSTYKSMGLIDIMGPWR